MTSALLVNAVVREFRGVIDVHITDTGYPQRRQRAAKKWGVGTALKVRIEPEEDAYTYGQIKHYWGHVVDPFSQETGYHKAEVHVMLKAECLPEGKTSITELTRQELQAFTDAAEQKAREWCPEAFLLYDRTRVN